MVFNSFLFVTGFLPVILACHWLAVRSRAVRAPQVVLLVASLGFYAWGRPGGLVYLLASILFNFAVAVRVARTPLPDPRRRWLVLGLAGNLLFLGVLKYARFAQSTLLAVAGLHLPVPEVALPLGVSFFTLQQVMYLVDCYESLVPAHSLFDHASFVAFFPVLSMGPLVKAKQMLGQLRAGTGADAEQFAKGSLLLFMGLCKKVFLAEALATLAEAGFQRHLGQGLGKDLGPGEAWLACLAYALQIYFDFSGYSDMALGAGLMLGFRLPPNFQSPYRSRSIIEFWQRWHLTLSQFITTYLYTPILRTFRKATLGAAAIATMAAMTLAGLWHGPSWNFVVFGVIHGAALVVNQYWRKKVKRKLPAGLSWLLTLGVVLVAFVFFRTATLAEAFGMLKALVAFGNPLFVRPLAQSLAGWVNLALFVAGLGAATLGPNSNEWVARMRPSPLGAAALAALALTGILYLNSSTMREFIYNAF